MNIEEFLKRYGGLIRASADRSEFLLELGRRDYTAHSPQACVDAALNDAMVSWLQARQPADAREGLEVGP